MPPGRAGVVASSSNSIDPKEGTETERVRSLAIGVGRSNSIDPKEGTETIAGEAAMHPLRRALQ